MKMMRRVLCLLLCLCILSGAVTPAFAAEAGGSAEGQFALAVLTADGIVIEPTYLSYDAGATVKQALLDSEYEFDGLEDQGWIQQVKGVSGSYSLFYDDNGYDLTVPASSITVLCITTKVDHYSAEYLELVRTMAEFNANAGVQGYSAAAEAYEAAEQDLYTATANHAAELNEALANAIEEYEKYIRGDLVTLTLDVDGVEEGWLTNQFGDTYEVGTETERMVTAGEYEFDLSDGGINHIRGSISVTADTTLTAELPSGQWLDSMELSIANGDDWAAVEKLGDWTFAVPDYSGKHLYPYFVPGTDVDTSACAMYLGEGSRRTWLSKETVLARVLEDNSMEGAVLELEARQAYGAYVQYQTYPITIVRTPSLASLQVSSDGTKLPLSLDPAVLEYDLTTTGDSVDLLPQALCDGTTVMVDGVETSGEAVNVILDEGITEIEVAVRHENGQSSTYTLNVEKLDSVEVTISTDADSVAVYNAAGAEIAPVDGVYHLVPDAAYTYVTTANVYYHTSASFTASDGLWIHAPTPETGDALASMTAGPASTKNFSSEPESFDGAVHEYTYQVDANGTAFMLRPVLEEGFSDYTVTAYYDAWNTGTAQTVVKKSATMNCNLFLGVSGVGNTLTLRVQKEVDGVNYYQDYILTARRLLNINDLSVSANGETVVLNQENTTGYSKFVLDYTAEVGQTVEEITLSIKLFSAANDNAVQVTVANGEWS